MHKCEHCGSTFGFHLGGEHATTTNDMLIAVTSFWLCPACDKYSTLGGMVFCTPGTLGAGHTLPPRQIIPISTDLPDYRILAQFTNEQIYKEAEEG
jgi:hypothetical protein